VHDRRDLLTTLALALSQSPDLKNVRVSQNERVRFNFEGQAYETGARKVHEGEAYERIKEKNKRIQAALRAFKKQYTDFYSSRYNFHKQTQIASLARSSAERDLRNYRPEEWITFYDSYVHPDRPPRIPREKNRRYEAFKIIKQRYRAEYDSEVKLYQALHPNLPKKDAHTPVRNKLIERYRDEFQFELDNST